MKPIEELEKQEMKTFCELHPCAAETNNLREIDSFLYHGIRYQEHLEILENIFKEGKILAAKNIPDFPEYRFSDNCNDGEYVSLLEYNIPDYQIEWDTFIKPNVTLVVSPKCNAKQTIYVPTYQWDDIKRNYSQTKNRYSYMEGEYQVKDYIPLSMIIAIGLPYEYLVETKSEEFANKYLEDTVDLMKAYKIYRPIIDTSFFNFILTEVKEPITIPNCDLFKKTVPGLTPKSIKKERPGFKVYTKQYMKYDNKKYKR